MQTTQIIVQEVNGQSTVDGLSLQLPFENDAVSCLANLQNGKSFSAFPLVPGVDVSHDTATGVGALTAGSGLVAGETIQLGTFSVATTTTGTISDVITFAKAFPSACDGVLVSFTGIGGAVINGGPYVTSESSTGATVNVDVTTAGTSNATGVYVAFGH